RGRGLRGQQYLRRAPQLCDPGRPGGAGRAAAELRQAVLCLALYGHGDDLPFPACFAEERVGVAVEVRDAAGPVLAAAFAGRRVELGDAALLREFLRSPAQAAKVLGGIHWQALK